MKSLKEELKNIEISYCGSIHEAEINILVQEKVKEAVLGFDYIIENTNYNQDPEHIRTVLNFWKKEIFGDWEE